MQFPWNRHLNQRFAAVLATLPLLAWAIPGLPSRAFGEESTRPDAPLILDGGVLWSGAPTTLTVPKEGFDLSGSTHLQVDRLVLNGRLRTLGHELKITAREIVFSENGRITAFEDAPAQAGQAGEDATPRKAQDKSERQIIAGCTEESNRGLTGSDGLPGGDGADGFEKPGTIEVMALQTDGKLRVDGRGQAGGPGGNGGKGQNGGDASNGLNAASFCAGPLGLPLQCDPGKAGDGGNGGEGGYGGKGGNGGAGGAPVLLKLLLGGVHGDSSSLPQLFSDPGSPGEPGAAGPLGNTGKAGKGGEGSDSAFDLLGIKLCDIEIAEGRDGYSESAPSEKRKLDNIKRNGKLSEKEPKKRIGAELLALNELKRDRTALENDWLTLHWLRMAELLVVDSIRLMAVEEGLDRKVLSQRLLSDEALPELGPEKVSEMRELWREHLIDPIQRRLEDPMKMPHSQRASMESTVQLGENFVAVLASTNLGNALRDYHKHLRNFRITQQDSVQIGCESYESLLKKAHLDDVASDLLEIPSCDPNALRGLMEDVAGPILLAERIEQKIPGGLTGMVQTASNGNKSSIWTSLLRALAYGFRTFGIPNAFAEDAVTVVIAPSRPLTWESIADALNREPSRFAERGMLSELQAPAQNDLTLQSLPRYLRSAAYQSAALNLPALPLEQQDDSSQ